MQIRAAVFESASSKESPSMATVQDLQLEDRLLDKEILVRVISCAVCHADIAARDGAVPFPLPGVLGHEGTGVVERIGAKVTQVTVGDHVMMTFPNDGTCGNCLSGKPRWCVHGGALMWSGRRYDGSPTALYRDKQPIASHLFQQSAFATHVIATEMNVVVVPKELPLEKLIFGCGMMTGAGGVLNSLKPEPGSSIAIFGAGGVGTSAIMAAKLAGCETIIVVEPKGNRRAIARDLGATDVLDATPDVAEQIKQRTQSGVDHSLVCVGNAEAITLALDSLRIGGQCGVI